MTPSPEEVNEALNVAHDCLLDAANFVNEWKGDRAIDLREAATTLQAHLDERTAGKESAFLEAAKNLASTCPDTMQEYATIQEERQRALGLAIAKHTKDAQAYAALQARVEKVCRELERVLAIGPFASNPESWRVWAVDWLRILRGDRV